MNREIKTILVFALLMFGAVSSADGIRPWPFPWAKDCPMAWENLDGEYKMVGSSKQDQIIVRVSTNEKNGLRTIRLVRTTYDGLVSAFGLAIVFPDEREVKIHMIPMAEGYQSSWVTLRMYYNSSIASCDMQSLVPILSVSPEINPGGAEPVFDYLLTKKN